MHTNSIPMDLDRIECYEDGDSHKIKNSMYDLKLYIILYIITIYY